MSPSHINFHLLGDNNAPARRHFCRLVNMLKEASFLRLTHSVRASFRFGRRVCRLPRIRSRKLSDRRKISYHHIISYLICSNCITNFRRLHRKSGSPSKNTTSDFAPKVAINTPKVAPNPKIMCEPIVSLCERCGFLLLFHSLQMRLMS